MHCTRVGLFLAFILVVTLCVPAAFAEDYTQLNLPEGAKARFGKGIVTDIKYSPDGMRLAVAGSTGIWLYDVQTGDERDLFTDHTNSVNSVAFSPDGRTLATGAWNGIVLLWDIETDNPLRTLKANRYEINDVCFSPDGSKLATGSSDGLRFWEATTGSLLYARPASGILSVSFRSGW